MPLSLDPDRVVWIVLDVDKAKSEDARPAFKSKFLTCREVIRIEDLITEARASDDQPAVVRLLSEAIGVGVSGWRNMPGEFSAEKLADVLTPRELWVLAYQVVNAAALSEDELKNSGWGAPSAGVPSAATAAPATA